MGRGSWPDFTTESNVIMGFSKGRKGNHSEGWSLRSNFRHRCGNFHTVWLWIHCSLIPQWKSFQHQDGPQPWRESLELCDEPFHISEEISMWQLWTSFSNTLSLATSSINMYQRNYIQFHGKYHAITHIQHIQLFDPISVRALYHQELEKVRVQKDDISHIENFLKPGKDRVMVKWRGYPYKFNSWVLVKDLLWWGVWVWALFYLGILWLYGSRVSVFMTRLCNRTG